MSEQERALQEAPLQETPDEKKPATIEVAGFFLLQGLQLNVIRSGCANPIG
jgi:hypothetical protein